MTEPLTKRSRDALARAAAGMVADGHTAAGEAIASLLAQVEAQEREIETLIAGNEAAMGAQEDLWRQDRVKLCKVRAERDALKEAMRRAIEQGGKLEAESARLREALKKYGTHGSKCAVYLPGTSAEGRARSPRAPDAVECNCGLREALEPCRTS